MTTLAASLSATDRVMRTVAALGIEANYPIPVLIGSECLIVTRQMAKAGYQYQVLRGQNGTAPAAHASGVSVTAYSGGGSGGVTVDNGSDPPAAVTTLVAQGADVSTPGSATLPVTVQRAGPFHVAFDTPGLAATGGPPVTLGAGGYVDLGPLPDGVLVIAAFPIVTVTFNGDGASNQSLSVAIQPADDPDHSSDLSALWGAKIDPTAPTVFNTNVHVSDQIAIAIVGAHLALYYSDGGGSNPTAGACDVYAIIVTPAS